MKIAVQLKVHKKKIKLLSVPPVLKLQPKFSVG